VSEICAGFGGGAHVFNLGHGVLPETPPAHVAELARILAGPPFAG
jgi:uroporphyrinogen decarboxylase